MILRRKGEITRQTTRTALLACVAVLGILVVAPAAHGQAVDQYSALSAPSPVIDQAGVIASGGTGGQGDVGGATTGGSAADEAGEGAGGKLPFTGYPLTPLLLLIAILLAAGIALRLAAPALDRRP